MGLRRLAWYAGSALRGSGVAGVPELSVGCVHTCVHAVTSLLGPCHSIAPRVGGGFRVRGSRHHAAHANAFTVAETDGQWFHLPGTSPPVGAGRLLPLSAELVSGYGAARG